MTVVGPTYFARGASCAFRSRGTSFAAVVDTLALQGTRLAARSRVDELGPAERMSRLDRLVERYDREDWLADPDAFFGPAPTVTPEVRRTSSARGARAGGAARPEVLDIRFPSPCQPLIPELAARYLSFPDNRVACARWIRGGSGRPAIVAIHGYGGGSFRFEARVFPTQQWLRDGFDVVLVALPFHGPRRAPGDRLRFPSSLPGVTIEGFRQAVVDLRGLIGWLLAEGASSVGVAGLSLGAYTAALLLTADARLSCGLAYIPLASLADYARDRGRLVGTPAEQDAQHQRLERVYRVVSPLHRPPLVPADRLLVVAGRGDRITPIRHAEKLAARFGCELVRLPGGHLVQLGRGRGWAAFRSGPLARLPRGPTRGLPR